MSRILIVEDTLEIAESLQQHLEGEGHDAVIATRAAQALALIASFRPELIVLDIGLPDRDGYDVLEQLRGRGNQMPVLILSARRLEADKVRGFRLGADDYVTKPFGAGELLARIAALLRRSRMAAGGTGDGSVIERPALGDTELQQRFGLTSREVDVARLLAQGLTNAEIAAALGISFYTVRTHTEHILAKLGVAGRAAVGAMLHGEAVPRGQAPREL